MLSLKKNIQEVGDFNELALLFQKFQSDLRGLEGGEVLTNIKGDNSVFKLDDAVKEALDKKHFDDSPLKALSFKNANKVDVSKLALLQDELNRFVNKVSTNIKELGRIMGNYADNVKYASTRLNAYIADYDEAVQELLEITQSKDSALLQIRVKTT